MTVVFFCSGCGSRFEVASNLAGKQARCKKCGQATRIPSAAAASELAARPVGVGGVATSAPAAPGAAPVKNWIDAVVASQVGLKPLSVAAIPAIKRQGIPSPLDDASFSGLYKVQSMPSLPALKGSGPVGRPGRRPAGVVARAYRGQIGGFQGVLRWVNDSAYLLSVPFLVLLTFGAIVKNGPLAMLGAAIVILLNIGRLVTGLINLVMIPLKESPVKGLLFVIPPVGLWMIASDWKRFRKPSKRVIEPALTLGAVLLTFTFVPWLRGADQPTGDLKEQFKEGVQTLETGIREKVGALPGDLKTLPAKASEILRSATPSGDPMPPPADAPNPGSEPAGGLESRLQGAVDQLQQLKSVREEIEGSRE